MTKMRLFLILRSFILIILAVGIEIHSLQLIVDDTANEKNYLLAALSLHLIACVIGAYCFTKIIAPAYVESPVRIYFFIFVILFYLPVLGLIALTFAIPLMWNHTSRPEEPAFPISLHKIRNLSAMAPDARIQTENIKSLYRSRNPERRLEAVYATLKIKDQDAIPLLRMALGDSVDDIRLLAYALLDRKEHGLSKNIKKLRQEIEKNGNNKNKFLYQKIAIDYLDLVRLGLVQGETKNYMLKMACNYIEQGLKLYPKDAGLCFQYGQVLLRLRKYQQAYEYFKKAENFGVERGKLLAYYAELAFYRQDYLEVKKIMHAIDPPGNYPQLSTIANFWRETPNAVTE